MKGVDQLDSDDFIFIDDKKVKFTFYHQEGVTGEDNLSLRVVPVDLSLIETLQHL